MTDSYFPPRNENFWKDEYERLEDDVPDDEDRSEHEGDDNKEQMRYDESFGEEDEEPHPVQDAARNDGKGKGKEHAVAGQKRKRV